MSSTSMPDVGARAPDFEGETQDGSVVRLSDYLGQKVALYFYPKDDTSGCTNQACNLRDGRTRLLDAGIAVIGVSTDSVASHSAFASKYELPFPLVADPDRKIVDAYGVYGEKKLYGRTYMGTKRTTFLINEEGVIQHVFKKPRVGEHASEILEKFGVAERA